jgi:carboxymethylenebutenolidase
MIKSLLLLIPVFLFNLALKTEPVDTSIPVCYTPANDMSEFAGNPAFQQLHDTPAPFTYQGQGEMVSFPASDGKPATGFLIKATKKSDKWLFVYQEWWGLNDHIKREASKLYGDLTNVNVLALDMYDGKIGTTREEAGKLMQAATSERLNTITKAALDYAGKNAKIASVGWCFGGMLSLQSAIAGKQQIVGCVMYYGRPEKDVEKLKLLSTDVLGIFGTQDQGIPPAVVEQFEKDMKAAGKTLTVKIYDAVHGFANPSNAKYDPVATTDAYKHTVEYLKKKLG